MVGGVARRKAIEITQRLEAGLERVVDQKLRLEDLIEEYFRMSKAQGLAPKSLAKYRTDLDKIQRFCAENHIALANHFTKDVFYRYREWLVGQDYADKTVYGALTLCKQVFKWAYEEKKLATYTVHGAKIAKAHAKPQPCFTTEQVFRLMHATEGAEQAAISVLGLAGLRIGELEQLHWQDVNLNRGDLGVFHIRRGGSDGRTKNKEHRFIPIHPRIHPCLESLPIQGELVFPHITERQLLKRVKSLSVDLGFPNGQQFKLHSFRHHFASLCANNNVAYKKALTWLGHSSSDILDLYYHLHDADSQAAMLALAKDGIGDSVAPQEEPPQRDQKGTSRATGQSEIKKPLQTLESQALAEASDLKAERGGFEPPIRKNRIRHFQCRSFSRSDTSPGCTGLTNWLLAIRSLLAAAELSPTCYLT